MNLIMGHGIWEYPLACVGISYRMKSTSELLSDEVEVEREPTNPIDEHAVAVYSVGVGKRIHIGYLPKEVSAHIYDQQLPAKGKITWKTEEADKPGVRILI